MSTPIGSRIPEPAPSTRLLLASTGWLTLLAVTHLPGDSPLRLAVVSLFVVFAPGAALRLPLRAALTGHRQAADRGADLAEAWVLVVVLSLSALALVAVGLMLAGAFTGLTTLVVLAVITMACALLPTIRPAAEQDGPGGDRTAG
jgi:uncharacterized membrane protein